MARKPLPNKDYVAEQGLICPNCRSKDIGDTAELVQAVADAYQDVKCNDCGATWVDCHTLHSYAQLVVPQDG